MPLQIWCKSNTNQVYHIWDLGEKQWCMNAEGDIRHYIILIRKEYNSSIHETILEKKEVPIPIEAFYHKVEGYSLQISEKTQCYPEDNLPIIVHTSIQDSLALEKEDSNSSYMFPSELWLSLSQWIPPERLYQSCLHNQILYEGSPPPHKFQNNHQGFRRFSGPPKRATHHKSNH